jgi:hypothetical protein
MKGGDYRAGVLSQASFASGKCGKSCMVRFSGLPVHTMIGEITVNGSTDGGVKDVVT